MVSDLTHTSSGRAFTEDLGRRPESLFSREYVDLLVGDTGVLLTSPLHWDRQEWMIAGGLTSLVLASSALDRQIREESQEHRTKSLNTFTQNAQRFGAEGAWLVLGAFETYGQLARDQKSKSVALDGVTASIIAAGIVTPTLKWAVGRVRPNASSGVFDFQPFSGNHSFPSGHTTQAFAVASVIAAHYDQWWVQGLSYGVAGLVGYSRIEQNAHYASDVVAGAIIGTVVGRAIVHRHNKPKENAFNISPYIDGRGGGLVIGKTF
ncbi:hypothetical protein AW736_13530 [Termitidicoccus mucosus]|uniref:Phosphatidic acid phosphatase type 2/haloperoxidase domain-containing protein n=1 Tax=Termitidicoccus mucosus TaxID=1184151 RepID=A0A178IGY6_9BACT|nr:hypothetical protein AW736_13530 [Opitutaceae bacterium TSB47]